MRIKILIFIWFKFVALSINAMNQQDNIGQLNIIYNSQEDISTAQNELALINDFLQIKVDSKSNLSEANKYILKTILDLESDDSRDLMLVALVRLAQLKGNLLELNTSATRPKKIELEKEFSGYYEEVQALFTREQNCALKQMQTIAKSTDLTQDDKINRLSAFITGIVATAFAQSLRVVSNTKSFYLFAGRHYFEKYDQVGSGAQNCGDIAKTLAQNFKELLVVHSDFGYFYSHVFNVLSGSNYIVLIDGYNGKIQLLETGIGKKLDPHALETNYLGTWDLPGYSYLENHSQIFAEKVLGDIKKALKDTQMGNNLDAKNNQSIKGFARFLVTHRFEWISETLSPAELFPVLVSLVKIGMEQKWIENIVNKNQDNYLSETNVFGLLVFLRKTEELKAAIGFSDNYISISFSQDQEKRFEELVAEESFDSYIYKKYSDFIKIKTIK